VRPKIAKRAIGPNSHNPERSRPSHCSGPVLDVQLAINIVEVPLERALRDEDGFGDFLVAEARLQALEDRELATGELFAQAGGA
jgi:hypothetical protein